MKRAFEKLKRRVEARKETVLPERNYMFGKLGVVSAEATNRTIDAVLSIVSEVEAEYGNDVCEWKNEKGMFIQNPHTGRKFSNEPSMKNVYCNTCGKKIKVVEL